MGDHRASIKIKFEAHGVKRECDMYINYHPYADDRMDQRVIDFFTEAWDAAYDKYCDHVGRIEEAEAEARERELLQDLKAKYEK